MLFDQLMSGNSPMTPILKSARQSVFEINFNPTRFLKPSLSTIEDSMESFKLNSTWTENIFNTLTSGGETTTDNSNKSPVKTAPLSSRSLYNVLDQYYNKCRFYSKNIIK